LLIDKISSDLFLPQEYVKQVIRTASHRYKTYAIPKKAGGVRMIHHPARELKLLQYWLIKNVCSRLSIHEAAAAYKTGANIRSHAGRHAAQNYLLRVDFRDFFPSITRTDITRLLREQLSSFDGVLESELDVQIAAQIVCRSDAGGEGRLTIGAPTSPVLSNAMMFSFDREWEARSREREVVYSRYADDVYFSTNRPNVLAPLLDELRADIRRRDSPRLQINDSKTAFSSRKRRRLVTGLVLTPTKVVSLGRPLKRKIKSLACSFVYGRLSNLEVQSLRGLISYARSIEPTFVESLARKYGAGVGSIL
jgi:RNA-directed DNA polymerase